MNISGKTRIFKKEINGNTLYSTTISSKNAEGKYENMYVNVQLPKFTQIENNTEIEIRKGFLSFYNNKDGLAQIKLIVQEIENQKMEEITNSSDLPF